jgi:hypothetical protein
MSSEMGLMGSDPQSIPRVSLEGGLVVVTLLIVGSDVGV